MNGFVTEKEFNLIHDLINLCDENNIPRDIQYRITRNLQFSLYMERDIETYRQMILAGGIPFIKEKPCKFVLETDGVTYGPMPEEDAPLLQRISMTENGHVTITLYNWNKIKLGSETFRVDANKATSLIKDMAYHFAVEPLTARATDVGSWKLIFTCVNKEKVVFCGDLLEDGAKSLYSDKLRALLGRENLLCFDGMDGSIRKYRICTCIFDSGENEYYYRSDDPDIKIGDTVIVPVGAFGRTSFATVTDIEFMEEDDIDYPLDKIKFIESSLVLPKTDGKDVSLFDIVKKAIDIMETLIGDSEDAVVVYYQTIDNESEFVHYLIHEFGHAISIRSNFDVYAEVQRDELYGVDSKRRAGSSIWSELIAEYIALQVDDRPFQEFSWVETDRLQCYLDEAVGGMQFDRYAFAFYLANYFGNGTIKEYLKRHPGAAIGLDKYDNELLEIIARVIDMIKEQLNKDRYWIVKQDMLDKLGDSFEELWDYCEQKNISRILKQMRK